jgi:hypothetical protein
MFNVARNRSRPVFANWSRRCAIAHPDIHCH